MARDEPEDYDDDDLTDDDDDEREGPEVGVTVEIVGLSLYTHHGVTAAEREIGQRLVLDVRFDVGEPDALITDRVEDTVDYGEVCQVIALIAQQRSYKTLERLCAVIADRLASQFGAESVTVKASKPEPPIPLPVEEVSVEVWREERLSDGGPRWGRRPVLVGAARGDGDRVLRDPREARGRRARAPRRCSAAPTPCRCSPCFAARESRLLRAAAARATTGSASLRRRPLLRRPDPLAPLDRQRRRRPRDRARQPPGRARRRSRPGRCWGSGRSGGSSSRCRSCSPAR